MLMQSRFNEVAHNKHVACVSKVATGSQLKQFATSIRLKLLFGPLACRISCSNVYLYRLTFCWINM